MQNIVSSIFNAKLFLTFRNDLHNTFLDNLSMFLFLNDNKIATTDDTICHLHLNTKEYHTLGQLNDFIHSQCLSLYEHK